MRQRSSNSDQDRIDPRENLVQQLLGCGRCRSTSGSRMHPWHLTLTSFLVPSQRTRVGALNEDGVVCTVNWRCSIAPLLVAKENATIAHLSVSATAWLKAKKLSEPMLKTDEQTACFACFGVSLCLCGLPVDNPSTRRDRNICWML